MSSDNGIYILRTLRADGSGDYEYRVRELQAIDNVNWDSDLQRDTKDPDVQIENARDMWVYYDGTPLQVIPTLEIAQRVAGQMADECQVLEYGICTLEIDRVFDPDEKPEDPSAFDGLYPDTAAEYIRGHDHGYLGLDPEQDSKHYLDGWARGRVVWLQTQRTRVA